MKWVRETEWKIVKFVELDEGECFFDAREQDKPTNLCMKIIRTNEGNTVVMEDGDIVAYDDDEMVLLVDAQVVVK